MSLLYHVEGIKPPDEKFIKMLDIYRLCDEQGIDPPKEVLKFFENIDYKCVEKSGITVSLDDRNKGVCKEWRDSYREGYELKVDDIPKDVKVIRFYISW